MVSTQSGSAEIKDDPQSQSNAGNIAGAIEYHPGGAASSEQVQSARIDLDQLGPVVVNQDGTLSRISNWAHMTEAERANTMRVLNRRNQQRMRALDQQEQMAVATALSQQGQGNNPTATSSGTSPCIADSQPESSENISPVLNR